jgi:hypothetical protein
VKVVLRDPPLVVLIAAILLNLPVRKVVAPEKPAGWMSRKLARLIEWRDQLSRRAS